MSREVRNHGSRDVLLQVLIEFWLYVLGAAGDWTNDGAC